MSSERVSPDGGMHSHARINSGGDGAAEQDALVFSSSFNADKQGAHNGGVEDGKPLTDPVPSGLSPSLDSRALDGSVRSAPRMDPIAIAAAAAAARPAAPAASDASIQSSSFNAALMSPLPVVHSSTSVHEVEWDSSSTGPSSSPSKGDEAQQDDDGRREGTANTRSKDDVRAPLLQKQTSSPAVSGSTATSSPSFAPLPAASSPSLSSSSASATAAANKRKAMVAQFIRSGETNIVFREKAPSILSNDTGVFYAPPVQSAARAPAPDQDRDYVFGSSFVDRAVAIPRRASFNNSPLPQQSSSPRRFATLGTSPMGLSSRQLMFQLTNNSSNNSASAQQAQMTRHRRSNSGVSAVPFVRQRSDSIGEEKSMLRASSASPARRSLTRPLIGAPSSPRLRGVARPPRSGRSSTGVPGLDEEARRREEQREASMLAPFLEARGNEDFVTYDFTRQQDYHKQMKEATRDRFRRWARAHKRKRLLHVSGEDDGDAVRNAVDEDEVHNKLGLSSHSSDNDASDDDGEDNENGGTPLSNWCRRLVRASGRFWLIRGLVKALMLGQGWLICGVIGAVTGLLASVVDLAVQWVIDIKSGYCSDAFYLSNSFCCAGSQQWVGGPDSQPLLLMCDQWNNWDANPAVASSIGSLVSPFFAAYFFYVILGVTMACLSAWLVLYYSPHAAGSGIPEIKTILGGVVIKKYLGGWTLLIKCVALILSVGSGLSLGKEGGFIHVACCVANILSRYFPEFKNNQYKKNEAISAAAAAGISVAFGAPVGGVLFSLEEVASYFPHKTMWRAFFCAIIASIVVQSIDPYQEGKLVLFQLTYTKPWYWFEMVPFALIGVSGGVLGAMFIRFNSRVAEFRKRSIVRRYPMLEVAAVAAVTVIIKYLSAFLRGNNNAVLASLFSDCKASTYYDPLQMCDENTTLETIGSLIFTCVCTFFFTTFTWSLCVPGGVFVPALIIGASYGRLVGTLMLLWQRSHHALALFEGCDAFTPGIYALVGAASMLGGVTRMTVCLVVIMFELTGGVSYLLPIMVGIMFSKIVGDAFDRRSIFESHLVLYKYPFLNAKDRIPPHIRVADAMSKELLALPMHGHTVASLTDQLALLSELRITGFPIVTTLKDRFVVGYVSRSELYTALCRALRDPAITPNTRCYFAMLSLRFPRTDPYVDLRPWLHPSPIQVVEHTPLYRVHDMFKKLGLRYALVTNFGKLVGVLTKKDILNTIDVCKKEEERRNSKKKDDADDVAQAEPQLPLQYGYTLM